MANNMPTYKCDKGHTVATISKETRCPGYAHGVRCPGTLKQVAGPGLRTKVGR